MPSATRFTTAVFAFCFVASASSGSPAAAQSRQQVDWCINAAHTFSPDQQIDGCTAAIQSHKWSGKGLAWAFNNRGFAYFLKRYLDPALEDFEQAIRLDPKDAVAFNNRGLIYRAKGAIDKAIADFGEAIRLDPKYIFAYNNRGGAYELKGDYDRAIAEYSEAIRIEPRFSVALKARGNAYAAKHDFNRAIADYDKLIALNPKYAAAFYNRAIAYQREGNLDRAIADYSETVRLDPKDALAFNNRGNIHQLKGDFADAVADYSDAIRLDPKESGMYFNRGVANFYSGNRPQALADFTQASEMNPHNAYAALWRDIADRRSDRPSRLAQAVPQLDMNKWPAAVVRLYLGQASREAVLAAADSPDATTKKIRTCEANFFSGEMALLRGAKDAAEPLLRAAAAECGNNTFVWAHANAELKALGAMPAPNSAPAHRP